MRNPTNHDATTIGQNSEFRYIQLEALNQNIEWDDLVDTVFPYYVKSDTGCQPLTVESMLRIYILLRHLELTPSEMEETLTQKEELRDFALMDLSRDTIPSADCITEFSSILFEESLMLKIEQALNGYQLNQ